MKINRLFVGASLALCSLTSAAITPLWMRDASISPDGKWITFTYCGDIYKVPAKGGEALRLTTLPAYDERPVWSPDGKKIAFASDRNGNPDIYIMDADGGDATRLTFYSGAEYPTAFTPDGKAVIFNASIQDAPESALFPRASLTELYSVPAVGGRVSQLLSTPAESISYLPSGHAFLYQDVKGIESEWRKHHTSSVTRDIWLYDTTTGRHTNLTSHAGEDRNPVVSSDGTTAYILSERDGKSMNIYSFPLDNPQNLHQVTSFKTHPLRFLSAAADGTLAFTYNGEIYTLAPGGKPTKTNIEIRADRNAQPQRIKVSSSNGATASPDGSQVAFSFRGDIFVTSTGYTTTKQITSTPAADGEIDWNPDGRSIAFTSERDGYYNIYTATIGREDEPNFSNATIIEEKALFSDGHDRQQPRFSPDGKKLAFVLDRQKLMVMDLKSKKVTQLTDGTTNPERDGDFSFEWSPDGSWIVFELTGNGHEPYADIAIVNTEGKPVVTNLTRSAYFDMNPKWALDGNAIVFESDRYGMRNHASWGSQSDVMALFLNQDAYDRHRLSKEDYELLKDLEKRQKADKAKASAKTDDKKKKADAPVDSIDEKSIKVELDGIQDRIVRLTPYSGAIRDFIVTKDGETLYYLFSGGNKDDLWKLDMRKREPSVAARIGANGRHLQLADGGKELFILGANGISKMGVKSEKTTPVTYSATLTLDPAAERAYMFQHIKREIENRFYEKNLHGVDWKGLTSEYSRFLPHIDNNYDFSEMLSELLGELNVSHTGSRYYPRSSGETTASLGLLFDWNYGGPGLRVAEIVEGGPFDHANTILRRGAVIKSINRTPLTADIDYTSLLADLSGKKTLVEFTLPEGGDAIEEVVMPVTTAKMNQLLYHRWVRQRAADVDSLSGGRLGYVHLPQMDDAAFRQIYIDLLGKYVDREGVVIDTRFNGGGRLHEDIEVLFSGDKYLTQVIRGQDICDMPSRRWNKPSIMLQCEANYSNAHGTPWVYKHKNLGSLVGAPVPGTMTSVNWETLQDPSLIFGIPVIGYRTAEGNYLENSQLEPDILILNDPARIVKGEDQQLKAAVDTLLRQIDGK